MQTSAGTQSEHPTRISSTQPHMAPSIQVFGVGLPRTETKSFCAALAILLDGPVCHAGSTCMWREEDFIKKWISILYPTPKTSFGPLETLLRQAWLLFRPSQIEDKPAVKAENAYVKSTLQDLMTGYVGAADAPVLFFAGELAELYPKATFICTTRVPDEWWESYTGLVSRLDQAGEDAMNLFKPTMRHYLSWKLGIVERRKAIYSPKFEVGPDFMDVHEEYLRSVVPSDRLYFYNVKDGWEPLCRILGRPIPTVAFPYIDETAKPKPSSSMEFYTQWLKFILTPITAGVRLLGVGRN